MGFWHTAGYALAVQDSCDVTISIVSGGNPELLQACLRSLPRAAAEVSTHAVVVDNASGGALAAVAREHPEATLVTSTLRRGFGANHNLALRDAGGRYLFVLNDDTELGPGCLDRLVRFMDGNPDVACAGPRVVYGDGRRQPSAFHFPTPTRVAVTSLTLQRAGWVMSDTDRIRRVDWVHGCAMLVLREDFQRLGGFDEGFYMYLEDVDLCRRLAAAGRAVAFFPYSWLAHLENASTASNPERRIYQHARSRSRYARKHHGVVAERSVQLLTAGMFLGRIGASALCRRDPEERVRFRTNLWASLRPGGRPAVEEAAAEYNQGAAA